MSKLDLKELRVQSFVTSFDKTKTETEEFKGGRVPASQMCGSLLCDQDGFTWGTECEDSGPDYCDYGPTEYTLSGCDFC